MAKFRYKLMTWSSLIYTHYEQKVVIAEETDANKSVEVPLKHTSIARRWRLRVTRAIVPTCLKASRPPKDWYRQPQWLLTYSPHICSH